MATTSKRLWATSFHPGLHVTAMTSAMPTTTAPAMSWCSPAGWIRAQPVQQHCQWTSSTSIPISWGRSSPPVFASGLEIEGRVHYNDVAHVMDNFSLRQAPMPMMQRLNTATGSGSQFLLAAAVRWGRVNVCASGSTVSIADHESIITNPANAMFRVDNFVDVERNLLGAFVEWRGGEKSATVNSNFGGSLESRHDRFRRGSRDRHDGTDGGAGRSSRRGLQCVTARPRLDKCRCCCEVPLRVAVQ